MSDTDYERAVLWVPDPSSPAGWIRRKVWSDEPKRRPSRRWALASTRRVATSAPKTSASNPPALFAVAPRAPARVVPARALRPLARNGCIQSAGAYRGPLGRGAVAQPLRLAQSFRDRAASASIHWVTRARWGHVDNSAPADCADAAMQAVSKVDDATAQPVRLPWPTMRRGDEQQFIQSLHDRGDGPRPRRPGGRGQSDGSRICSIPLRPAAPPSATSSISTPRARSKDRVTLAREEQHRR